RRNKPGNSGSIEVADVQQPCGKRFNLSKRTRETARLRKRQSIDRAIAANAGDAAEQRVACNLTRDKTGVELQDDFVPSQFSQIIGIRQLPVQNAELLGAEPQLGKKSSAFAPLVVENGDGLAGGLADASRDHERGEMITRRHVPFAGPDENSGALFEGPREIPARIVDRIRGRDERDA